MKKLILFLGIILNSAFSYSQISIDTDPPNDDIVFLVNNILLSTNLQASNHVFCGDSIQLAYFNAESTNLGFNSGIVLSTGDVSPLEPNFSGVETIVGQDPSITDDDLLEIANSVPDLIGQNFQVNSVNDIASIDFDFIATSDSISFNYVFASQEYFAFENSQYNDVFGFFHSGTGITGPYSSPSSFPDGSINIATFKSQELNSLGQSLPITVSSICNFETNNVVYNPHLFVNNQSFESQSNLGSAYVRYKEPIFPHFITSIDSVLFPVDEPILLDGIPQCGVFSGKGVDFEGYFHPINAYEGQSYIYYSFPLNCNETDSILVEVDCEVQIYIPNSFTPNNDLVNDFLEVRGNNIIDFEFSIYSRWSEQVFHTTDINSHWNGKYNGRLVPTGTYAYTISAYGKDAKIFKKNGYVNVIH